MIFNEKTIVLKNGKTALLKSPEPGDGAKMLDYIKRAYGETEFLVRYPEEWDGVSVEGEEKWIKNGRDSRNDMKITCYVDAEIAGNCEIIFHTDKKTCHRAELAIAILEKYWGLGIGSAMFEELIAAARAHEGTEIVELKFVEGNERARALYEKFGFRIVSERPNAFKLRDGSLVKLCYMQKIL